MDPKKITFTKKIVDQTRLSDTKEVRTENRFRISKKYNFGQKHFIPIGILLEARGVSRPHYTGANVITIIGSIFGKRIRER